MVWEAAASLSSARLSSRRGAFYFSSSPGTWRAGSRGDWNESVDALQAPRGAALQAWGRGGEGDAAYCGGEGQLTPRRRAGPSWDPHAGRGAAPLPRPHSLASEDWRGLGALIVQAAGTSWEGELA